MPKLREGVTPKVQFTIRLSETALLMLNTLAGDGGASASMCIEHLVRKAHREYEKQTIPAKRSE